MSDVEEYEAANEANPWFDWENNFDLPKDKVIGPDGRFAHPDVLKSFKKKLVRS